jgi:2-dehydro-3-deoxyphosphogluconate aldolase / (4S)-4-hydroxy-2-oxoglutarate aldolase
MPYHVLPIALEDARVIAIIRHTRPTDLVSAVGALVEGGIRAVELTLNTPGALQSLGEIVSIFGEVVSVGVGTVLDVDGARRSLEAGVHFVVTPTLQPDTIETCREAGVHIIAGSMTPTEALAAHRAGASYIKLFPADSLGPAFVKSILGPLPFLKIVPTGGITLDNFQSFLSCGCIAVGVGGSLVGTDLLDRQDWTALTAEAARYARAAGIF